MSEPSHNPDLADLIDRRMDEHESPRRREEARRALLADGIRPAQPCECGGATTTDLDGDETCMKCGRPPA